MDKIWYFFMSSVIGIILIILGGFTEIIEDLGWLIIIMVLGGTLSLGGLLGVLALIINE